LIGENEVKKRPDPEEAMIRIEICCFIRTVDSEAGLRFESDSAKFGWLGS